MCGEKARLEHSPLSCPQLTFSFFSSLDSAYALDVVQSAMGDVFPATSRGYRALAELVARLPQDLVHMFNSLTEQSATLVVVYRLHAERLLEQRVQEGEGAYVRAFFWRS